MIELINAILELDKEAQNKLKSANDESIAIRNAAVIEEAKIRQDFTERITRRINKVRETEDEYLAQQMAELDEAKSKQLATLDSVFNSKLQLWEDEIFNRIVGV